MILLKFILITSLVVFVICFIVALLSDLKRLRETDYSYSSLDVIADLAVSLFWSVVAFIINMVIVIILSGVASTTVVSNRSTTVYNLASLSNNNVTQTTSTGSFFLLAGSYEKKSVEINRVTYIVKNKEGYMKYHTLKSNSILIKEDNNVKPQLKKESTTTISRIPLYGYFRPHTKVQYFFIVPEGSVNKTYNFNVNK